jgi:hypothetical protein
MKLLHATLAVALLASGAPVTAQDTGAPSFTQAESTSGLVSPAPSERPPEERIALARRYVALAMPEESELQDMRDLSQQVIAALSVAGYDDESASDREWEKDFIDRVMVKAAPIIRDHMLSIREVTAIVYASEFSSAELNDMIAFGQTPGGRHYLARQQFLDLNPAIMAQQRLLQEAIAPVYSDVRKDICQEETAKRIAAGDKKAKCPYAQQKDVKQG